MYPLPVFSHWQTGTTVPGFGPSYQLNMLPLRTTSLLPMESYHPWLAMPVPRGLGGSPPLFYYQELMSLAIKNNLPLSFIGSQWERVLLENEFFNLSADQNPNILVSITSDLDGKLVEKFERKLSPFGPLEAWREAGRRWGGTEILQTLQKWYRDPPQILFLSNNEAPLVTWDQVQNYQETASLATMSPEDCRSMLGYGYASCYRALFEGLRSRLTPAWRQASKMIGYNAFVPGGMARWGGWEQSCRKSLHTGRSLTPWPECWDGCSMPYYTAAWDGVTDHTMWSVQTEAMNWAAAREQFPDYWFELLVWDGNPTVGGEATQRAKYEAAGQSYFPERYLGSNQFGLWLLRPNVLREFRGHREPVEPNLAYFNTVIDAVERVRKSTELQDFWKYGKLLLNSTRQHPYDVLPPRLPSARWYALETNLTPSGKWKFHTSIPVWVLGLVNSAGDFLLYGHTPLDARLTKVVVDIPLHRKVTIPEFKREGSFWLVSGANSENAPPTIRLIS